MTSEGYLNIKEAARYLGVSDVKIRRLISKRLLIVSLDPLDDRKRLVKKIDLDSLKTPRQAEDATTQRQREGAKNPVQGKKTSSNANQGSISDES
jgi:hypothetical protein